ncbi:MAG: DUF4330 family protein [Clostridia bacterium]|nr:DUF4330 family protein [Clostridia bacterium]
MENKKFKVNILDFLIIALVLLCIGGVALRGQNKRMDERQEMQTATVSFLLCNVQEDTRYCFAEGDRVYDETHGCEFGRFIGNSLRATPAVIYAAADGKIDRVLSSSGRIDIRGSIACTGIMSESGFLVGGTQYIAPGMSVVLYFPKLNASVLITDIVPAQK